MDHIGELNDSTPSVKVGPKNPLSPDLVFGLDSKLFLKGSEEAASWAALGVEGAHTDEVETKSVWRGGAKPGSGKKQAHAHPNSDSCTDCNGTVHEVVTDVTPIPRADLEAALAKLAASREVYRAKGIVRFPSESVAGYDTYVLNWAFGRFTLTHIASLDAAPDLEGVSIRLTVMGERWEVRRHAKKFGEALGAQVA
jgi:G3E family GTPase